MVGEKVPIIVSTPNDEEQFSKQYFLVNYCFVSKNLSSLFGVCMTLGTLFLGFTKHYNYLIGFIEFCYFYLL